MSTNYTAYALIGVRFVQPDPPERREPSCQHAERLGQTFCPVCGTRVGERRFTNWMANADVLDGIENSLPDGWVLVRPVDGELQSFLGFGASRGWRTDPYWKSQTSLPSQDDIKALCRVILEPHGLWDGVEASFGLHCVIRGA